MLKLKWGEPPRHDEMIRGDEVGVLDTEAAHCPDVRAFSGEVALSAIGRWP